MKKQKYLNTYYSNRTEIIRPTNKRIKPDKKWGVCKEAYEKGKEEAQKEELDFLESMMGLPMIGTITAVPREITKRIAKLKSQLDENKKKYPSFNELIKEDARLEKLQDGRND